MVDSVFFMTFPLGVFEKHNRTLVEHPPLSVTDLDLDRTLHNVLGAVALSGKPVLQRSGDTTWLGTMSLGHYQVGDGPDGGSTLFPLCTADRATADPAATRRARRAVGNGQSSPYHVRHA